MPQTNRTVNFIDQPFFSVAELARVAGIDRGIADQWIHRGLISPTRVERAGTRRRPIFSVRDVFKAKLICILNDHFTFAPAQSARYANDSDCTDLVSLVAGEEWMYAIARSIDRGKPLQLWFAVTRIEKRWHWRLLWPDTEVLWPETKVFGLFKPGVPFIMLPLPAIFSPVYEACREIHAGLPPVDPKGSRRAES